jgi:hypothetical protein
MSLHPMPESLMPSEPCVAATHGEISPVAMERYCTVCRQRILDPGRIRRSSPYCSIECKKFGAKQARDLRYARKCRLCGRRLRKKKVSA